MKEKWLAFIVSAFIITITPVSADNYFDGVVPDNGTIVRGGEGIARFDIHIDKENWIPARLVLSPGIDKIYWDNEDKTAKFISDNKALVINFSDREYHVKPGEFLVPSKRAKFLSGKVYLDANWLGCIFDRYAELLVIPFDRSDYDLLRERLNFLNIEWIDVHTPYKDRILYLEFNYKK